MNFKIGKMVLLMAGLVLFVGACSGTPTIMRPVASLEEFTSKEELDKKRSWHKETAARNAITNDPFNFLMSPIALALKFFPTAETGTTIAEIADVAVIKNYGYKPAFISYNDSDYNVAVLSAGYDKNDLGLKPAFLNYHYNFLSDKGNKDNKFFLEAVIIKEEKDNEYWQWKSPILKRGDNGEWIYAFDGKLKLQSPPSSLAFVFKFCKIGLFHRVSYPYVLNFISSSSGAVKEEITKKISEVLDDAMKYFLETNPPMQKIQNKDKKDSKIATEQSNTN
jgi:hypothetical protein